MNSGSQTRTEEGTRRLEEESPFHRPDNTVLTTFSSTPACSPMQGYWDTVCPRWQPQQDLHCANNPKRSSSKNPQQPIPVSSRQHLYACKTATAAAVLSQSPSATSPPPRLCCSAPAQSPERSSEKEPGSNSMAWFSMWSFLESFSNCVSSGWKNTILTTWC